MKIVMGYSYSTVCSSPKVSTVWLITWNWYRNIAKQELKLCSSIIKSTWSVIKNISTTIKKHNYKSWFCSIIWCM